MTSQSDGRAGGILVAGLGNLLLMDDGVGVHAARLLQQDPPVGALVVDVGTAVLDAVDLLEQASCVLALDAMQAGGEPGTVYGCAARDIADMHGPASLHELGLLAVLHLIEHHHDPHVEVLGVEPGRIGYGMELSPPVSAALPQVVRLAHETVGRWLRDRSTEKQPCP